MIKIVILDQIKPQLLSHNRHNRCSCEQMQKMEQMLRDFCQKYAQKINKPQSEVETPIDEFLTGVRNASNMGSSEKLQSSAPATGAQPASGRLPPPTSLSSPPALPRSYPYTHPPHTAVPLTPAEPTHPSTSQPSHSAGPIQPSTPPLPPSPTAPRLPVW